MSEVHFIDDHMADEFDELKENVVAAAGKLSRNQVLELADTLHDLLRARREATFESIVEAGLA